MRLVLPMAGYGKRLRPHTWSRPKPLVSVAGKTVLSHFLDAFQSIDIDEAVFIIGYLGEQVKTYIAEHHPELKVRYVVQEELSGQSHAIWLAREGLMGPTLVAFVDTLIEADFSKLGDVSTIWAKEVDDPRRFGVVELNDDDMVSRLVEKPQVPQSNLAVVGFYYFPLVGQLIEAIGQQISGGAKLQGEFFLADAINVLLDGGLQMQAQPVAAWNDCGTASAILDTNRFLLEHGRDNSAAAQRRSGATIHPPVYLDPTAEVSHSDIGPHASIGPGCVIEDSEVRDSIVEAEAQIRSSSLSKSLIGRAARVSNIRASLNVSDDSQVTGRGSS